jgi:hypothetical protein
VGLTDTEIAAHVVRGAQETRRSELARCLRLSVRTVSLTTDDDCIDELLALPSPIPARDESTAAALLLYGLVHQWTSSRRALVAALERRVARGVALVSALETGRHPSRAELAAWTWSGEAVQLAFPEIVASVAGSADDDVADLLSAVRAHQRAVSRVAARAPSRHAANPTTIVRQRSANPAPTPGRADHRVLSLRRRNRWRALVDARTRRRRRGAHRVRSACGRWAREPRLGARAASRLAAPPAARRRAPSGSTCSSPRTC